MPPPQTPSSNQSSSQRRQMQDLKPDIKPHIAIAPTSAPPTPSTPSRSASRIPSTPPSRRRTPAKTPTRSFMGIQRARRTPTPTPSTSSVGRGRGLGLGLGLMTPPSSGRRKTTPAPRRGSVTPSLTPRLGRAMTAEGSGSQQGSSIDQAIEIDSPPPSPTLGIRSVQRAASRASSSVSTLRDPSPAGSEVSTAGTIVSLSDFTRHRRIPRRITDRSDGDVDDDDDDRLTSRSFTDVPGTPVPWVPFNTTDPRVKRRYPRAEDTGRGSGRRSPAYQQPQLGMSPMPVEVERKMQDLKVLLDMWDLDAVWVAENQPVWEAKVDLLLAALFAQDSAERLRHDLSEAKIPLSPEATSDLIMALKTSMHSFACAAASDFSDEGQTGRLSLRKKSEWWGRTKGELPGVFRMLRRRMSKREASTTARLLDTNLRGHAGEIRNSLKDKYANCDKNVVLELLDYVRGLVDVIVDVAWA